MAYSEYLMQAYEQKHPATVAEFLESISSMITESPLLELHRRFCKKYGPPKLGTSRVSYISKSVVFKLPVSSDGFRHNDWEGSLMSIGEEGDSHYIPLARSRLHPGYIDIPIVVMEKVEEASLQCIRERLGHIPGFVSAVDMSQVGFTKKGKLVAFDYADL
ncbi:hypothetical protein [Aeromonas veronii]|uniref:Uncharacterized protein n=1 Tax=Aeromonas veronii TaxID=654 RepID=A0A2T4MWY4_AERVE|nr:hypothetical protein [Aeromonas veronii]PTH79100.1 hypothetical protein DAA48_21925 [Aeromonas veronii]